jgi:uncharacterized protein YraI
MKLSKRMLSVVLAAIVSTASLTLIPARKAEAAIPAFEEAVIIAHGVNMRLRPTVDSPFVLKLNNGTRVGVFCEEVDGWYRILYGNYRGYVSKEYVFLPSTDMLVGNVLADNTPVFLNAGEFSEKIHTLNAGAGLTITSMQGDYYGVEYEGGGAVAGEAAGDGIAGEAAENEAAEEETQPAESSGSGPEATRMPDAAPEAETEAVEEQGPADGAAAAAEEEILAAPADESGIDIKRGYVRQDAVKTSASKNAANMIKEGMAGVEVNKMQRELRERGFLGAAATGEFGAQTKKAVTLFQEFAGLDADGIAGAKTLELLYGDNDIRCTYAQRMGIYGEVYLTSWDKMQDIYYKGCTAKITDVETGLSWYTRRFGGWFHADVEPVSADDTANMKEAAGGAWTWDRRAIWVTIDGVTYAASMNCMPHLSSTIDGNNFDGHHCIHFYHSKVHENSKECPRHQSMVQTAYIKGNS